LHQKRPLNCQFSVHGLGKYVKKECPLPLLATKISGESIHCTAL